MAETLEIKRITPEESLDDYISQGLKPAQNGYFPKDGCACGLGARAKKLGMDRYFTVTVGTAIVDNAGIRKNLTQLYNRHYHDGFACGFDGYPFDKLEFNFPIMLQGFEDGLACWEAVKHLAVSDE